MSGQQSLLELMVTVAGVFLAPSYLPLLAALISRRLTSRGALMGYILGIACGLGMLMARFSLAPHHSAEWMRTYDGISILLNTSVTILGMWAGTVLFATAAAELDRIQAFFLDYDRAEIRNPAATDPGKSLAKTTLAVGGLLALAAALASAIEAKVIDITVAAVLIVIGAIMWLRAKRIPHQAEQPSVQSAG